MNAQPDFFRTPVRRIETPAARNTDPESSHEAADAHAASGARQCHIAAVINAVRKYPGKTSAELAPLLGMERHEVARRLPDAETAGAVCKGTPRKCAIGGKCVTTWWPILMAEPRAA